MGCVVIALKTIFLPSIGSVEARFVFLSIYSFTKDTFILLVTSWGNQGIKGIDALQSFLF